jgi:hypothetical protein
LKRRCESEELAWSAKQLEKIKAGKLPALILRNFFNQCPGRPMPPVIFFIISVCIMVCMLSLWV